MMYHLRRITDSSAALAIYRRITKLRDRAENHYELRARQRGEDSIFNVYALSELKDAAEVGLVEYGKHTLLNSDEQAELSLCLDDNHWNRSEVKKLIQKICNELHSMHFKKVHVSTYDLQFKNLLLQNSFLPTLELVESSKELAELKSRNYPKLAEGLSVTTFKDILIQEADNAFDYIFPLVQQILSDIPGSREAAQALTPALIRKSWQGSHFLSEASFFLTKNDSLIGMHNVVSLNPQELRAGVTGVLAEHRRQGHMRTLKSHALIWGAKNNYKRFVSNNEKNNPMLSLNLELGFAEMRRSYEFEKLLP
jgi:hypothetical protein